tara:strand:- start:118 stop:306 length:189 start_codon:yes stop_codon:yes gene_type:complete
MVSEDSTQNERLAKLEERVNLVENDLAAILAKLDLSQQMMKVLLVVAGTALGVDVIPMMGGA